MSRRPPESRLVLEHHRERIETLEQTVASLDEQRFKLYQGNVIVDLLRKLGRTHPSSDTSSTPTYGQGHDSGRLQDIAKNFTKMQLKEHGLSGYWDLIKNASEVRSTCTTPVKFLLIFCRSSRPGIRPLMSRRKSSPNF